jgi:hypothetical protein
MTAKSHFLPILGLSAFAVAQPILNALGQGATFFVVHGAEAADVISFALTVFLLPPLLLCAIAGCVGLINATAGKACVSIMLAVLAGLFVMPFMAELPARTSISLALVVGLIVGLIYFRAPRFRELLQWVGALSPFVVIVFLFFTPVSSFLASEKGIGSNLEAQKDTPVVMLLFDELSLAAITTPNGQIDAGRLPNFARLAQMSTWYSNTTTVSTSTAESVPAILTGLRPREKLSPFYIAVVAFLTGQSPEEQVPPIYNEYPRNLFSLLAASHTIEAIESGTRLCPASACAENAPSEDSSTVDAAIGRDEFDAATMYQDIWLIWQHAIYPLELALRHLPSISTTWGNFDQEEEGDYDEEQVNFFRVFKRFAELDVSDRFNDFVSRLEARVGPTLSYLHLGLPHTPLIYLPDGTPYNGKTIPGIALTHWFEQKQLVDQGIVRYSMQVEYADVLLGQALDVLERGGRMNDVMLIVLSDHGTAFKPGGSRRVPEAATLADVARVPLFIKYPGQRSGERDDRKVETIDVFPTIADVVQLPLSEPVDGQSLISEGWQPAARHVLEAGNSIPDFEAAMSQQAASERIYEVIQSGVTALNATGFGEARPYTGKPVPDKVGFNDQIQLRITSHYCFQYVDLEKNFLPIHVMGVLEGASVGDEVMVALNGIIAGSGMAADEENTVSILLDPRKFIPWKNEVRAFSLTHEGVSEISVVCGKKGARLSPLP